MDKIEINIYRTAGKIKGRYLRAPDGYAACTNDEIFDCIRQFDHLDVIAINPKTKEDITYDTLINVLHSVEMDDINQTKDTKLLSRIIRNGGFINYINKLEGA